MNNPTEYLGWGLRATMQVSGAIELAHDEGDYIILQEKALQNLVAFRGRAQCEIASRQSLAPAYEFIADNKK